MHENLEHAHNIVLDLLIWAGLPVGVLITLAIGWWFFSRVRACNDASAWWWLIGLAGLGLHGLLEYPLEYAFFLIPAGIAVGAIEHHHPHATALAVRQLTLRGAAVALSAAVALLGWDYLRAEQAFRILRLESAGIVSQGLKTPPPDLLVLTQLEAFQRFAHTEARVGLRADELLWMQRVASRYAYPPAMLRQALAEGLNGQEEKAALTLQRLCRIHLKERCAEARTSWAQLQRRYPRLAAIPAP